MVVPTSADQPRRKRRRTRGAAADEEDEDSELHSAQYQSGHSLQVGAGRA